MPSKYYNEKASGYQTIIGGYKIEPMIYQPTTEGMIALSQKYKDKYGVNIHIIDERVFGDHEEQALKRIGRVNKEKGIDSFLLDDKPVGIILMHGEHHAIPILLSKEGDQKFMIIFDSNSGARIPGHYRLGNDFPEFQVMINLGTRQADATSCITDSISILKDALRMEGLGSYLLEHKAVTESAPTAPNTERQAPKRFFGIPKPDNFTVFKMPEELLKTAQSSEFVTISDPDINKPITKHNQSLRDRRSEDTDTISFNRKPEEDVPINSNLYKKSRFKTT